MSSRRTTIGRISRQPKQRRESRLGVAVTEFAVCLPIIVLLVLATIEACSMVFLKQSMTAAAYEGVRTALVPNATATSVETKCEEILADRRVKGASVKISPPNLSGLSPGDYVDVTITAPCDVNSIVPNMFYRGRNLSATASMMIEF